MRCTMQSGQIYFEILRSLAKNPCISLRMLQPFFRLFECPGPRFVWKQHTPKKIMGDQHPHHWNGHSGSWAPPIFEEPRPQLFLPASAGNPVAQVSWCRPSWCEHAHRRHSKHLPRPRNSRVPPPKLAATWRCPWTKSGSLRTEQRGHGTTIPSMA